MRVAIVGTRQPNRAQIQRCQEAVAAALSSGANIITGGAPGIDSCAIHAANTLGQAAQVTVVLPWQNFGGWSVQELRCIVFNPDFEVEHRDWQHTLLRLRPESTHFSNTSILLLSRDIGIVSLADMVVAFARPGQPDAGGTGFTIRVAQSFGKPTWVDYGQSPGGTPWRQALKHA